KWIGPPESSSPPARRSGHGAAPMWNEMWRLRTINPTGGCMTELLAIERALSCSPARVPPMRTGAPVPQDTFFGPEATRVMGAAFDKVCRSLHDSGQPSIVKEVIAKRIIDL